MEPEINKSISANRGSNKLVIILILLVIAAGVAAAIYYNKIRVLKQDPNKLAQEKIIEVVAKVSKIIDLPTGETPVIATISDTTPLANNPFFANAKIGDEVLMYTVSRKAFLYDPKANIIVEVASLNIGK
jgi:heme/copper-type cytochrome/quinol oxidase subunit 2